ncbi:MAG: MnmC family methyltransferase [Cyanobacteriota bacterium]|nr:MnmC family methyltransferase [Cyanobacteriota bacterium]
MLQLSNPQPSRPEGQSFDLQRTDDGSFTFFCSQFQEAFHSRYGAKQEAELKFVEPCQLKEKAKTSSRLVLLDICYGLGYNSAAAFAAIWQSNPHCQVQWVGLELNAEVPQAAIAHHLLDLWPSPIPQLLQRLAATGFVQTPQLNAKLQLGDARQTLKALHDEGFKADAIFLDPFSPPQCPQLWTVEFLALAAGCLQPTGRLATYSCAAAVRTALHLAQLHLGATPAIGRRSSGTVASFTNEGLPPLSQKEQEALQTRSAVPYRDRELDAARSHIVQNRRSEQQLSVLEPTAIWKKRWSQKKSRGKIPPTFP